MTRVALLLCAVVGACANLPTITPRCGNGVLDPGEDCDTPDDPQCQMCGWRCDPDHTCSSIPAPKRSEDYACGVDGFCHAPGGQLAPQSGAPAIEASSIYETDINGDGYGDVVGVSPTSLDTRYGDSSGQLATSALTVTAGTAGDDAIVDLDGDGRLDAIEPTRDGLVAYASPFGSLLPFAFTTEVTGESLTPLALVPLDGLHLVALFVQQIDGVTAIPDIGGVVIDFSTTPPLFTTFKPCDAYPSDPSNPADPNAVSVRNTLAAYATTDPTDPANPSVGFTFIATNASNVQQLCGMTLLEVSGTGSGTYTIGRYPIDAQPSVIAGLDTSTCPSVYLPEGINTVVNGPARYTGTRQTDHSCAYGPTPVAAPAIGQPGDAFLGHIPLSPAIAGLAPDAIVTSSGVYGIYVDGSGAADPTKTPEVLYLADRPLTAAASGDVNGDGKLDGVLLGNDSTLDVLVRTVASGGSGSDGFIRGRLATDSPPSHLVVADFDGNGVADISYVEQTPRGAALEVVYETVAGPLPAMNAADFGGVIATGRIALPYSADPNGLLSGLAVAESSSSASGSISLAALFYGSVDRTLIPYFDPRGGDIASTFRAVAGGHFVSGGTGVDVVAIEIPDGSGSAAQLWQLAGAPGGGIYYPVPGDPLPTDTGNMALTAGSSAVVDCALTTAGSGSACGDAALSFCIDGSKLVDWPERREDMTDDIIGIDARHACAFDLTPSNYQFVLAGSGVATASAEAITCAGSGACLPADGTATLTEAFSADLDGNGQSELVLAYKTADGRGGALACTVPAAGSAIVCQDIAAGTPYDGTCWDAVPAVGGFIPASESANSGTELAVLCGTAVFRVTTSAGAYTFGTTPLVSLPAGTVIDAIGVHDVTGDMLDDVLVLETDPDGLRRLHVFPQLSSREVAP